MNAKLALEVGVAALVGSQGGYMVLIRWGYELLHPAQKATPPPTKIIEVPPPVWPSAND